MAQVSFIHGMERRDLRPATCDMQNRGQDGATTRMPYSNAFVEGRVWVKRRRATQCGPPLPQKRHHAVLPQGQRRVGRSLMQSMQATELVDVPQHMSDI
jgi:hypothetical protein